MFCAFFQAPYGAPRFAGPVVGIRGIAITAWRGAKSRTPMPAHPPRRRGPFEMGVAQHSTAGVTQVLLFEPQPNG